MSIVVWHAAEKEQAGLALQNNDNDVFMIGNDSTSTNDCKTRHTFWTFHVSPTNTIVLVVYSIIQDRVTPPYSNRIRTNNNERFSSN